MRPNPRWLAATPAPAPRPAAAAGFDRSGIEAGLASLGLPAAPGRGRGGAAAAAPAAASAEHKEAVELALGAGRGRGHPASPRPLDPAWSRGRIDRRTVGFSDDSSPDPGPMRLDGTRRWPRPRPCCSSRWRRPPHVRQRATRPLGAGATGGGGGGGGAGAARVRARAARARAARTGHRCLGLAGASGARRGRPAVRTRARCFPVI
jgi:hypothetical protein